jgi:hypothetical protein
MDTRRKVNLVTYDPIKKEAGVIEVHHGTFDKAMGFMLVHVDPADLCPAEANCDFCKGVMRRVRSRTLNEYYKGY